MYQFEITKKAENKLKKFDCEIQRRFFKKMEKLVRNPEMYGKPLRNVLSGTWEMYFENSYRIFYSINKNREIITIESIPHKDEIKNQT